MAGVGSLLLATVQRLSGSGSVQLYSSGEDCDCRFGHEMLTSLGTKRSGFVVVIISDSINKIQDLKSSSLPSILFIGSHENFEYT